MVSRLWKTGTITVLPLSFLTAICTTAKHTSEPTNWGGGGGAARNDPYENPIHPGRAGAEAIGERGGGGWGGAYLLPRPGVGEGDGDVAGRLERSDDVVLATHTERQREARRQGFG